MADVSLVDQHDQETAQERGDRLVREAQAEVTAKLERLAPEIVRVVGWVARYGAMGYGPHVATRDSSLPPQLRDWIKAGCPDA